MGVGVCKSCQGSTVQTSKPNNEVKAASQRLVELSDESFYSVSASTVLLNGALNYRLDRSRLIMIVVFLFFCHCNATFNI